ncbi:MAG: hypothetical protein RIR01_2346 [Bacteroidota bacterium]|jgi:hypothetical protein
MAEEQNTDFKYNEVYIQGLDDWDDYEGRVHGGCLVPFLFIVVLIIIILIYVVVSR